MERERKGNGKETTHGESERETDERLDQDMRKDDEEPRAARE